MEKRSFLMYLEYEDQLSDLTDEELGQLMRAIFKYERDGMEPKFNGLLKMAFSFIKGNLNRDKQKYDKRCETSAINGKKGGRPSTKKPNSKPNEKPKKPKKADNDNDNDNEIDNEIDNDTVLDNDNGNDNEIIELSSFFENEFGQTISGVVYDKLLDYLKIFDIELIKQAIRECVYSGVRNLNYLNGILKSWNGQGIKTYSQWQAKNKIREKNKKPKVEVFNYDWLNEEEE